MSSAMDVDSLTQTAQPDDPYDSLPECIRQYYSREAYLWLSDEEKGRLEQTETEPDW